MYYAEIIYDQAYNSAFHDKLESIQYNVCLAITDTIRGTSIEKVYQELALNLLNPDVGLENFLIFVIYSMKNPPRIYSI